MDEWDINKLKQVLEEYVARTVITSKETTRKTLIKEGILIKTKSGKLQLHKDYR